MECTESVSVLCYTSVVRSASAFRWVHVVLALGWSDFLLKYRGSFLGYLWSFIVPMVKFLVILHIFRPFVGDIPYYPLYLFLGLILWEHFSATTLACIQMPLDKSTIIKKVAFPRILLMLSVGWMHIVILSTYMCIFFLFTTLVGPGIPWSAVLYLPLVFLQASLIGVGVGMILGSYSLKYRDIPHLWNVILQIFFWLTPIAYAYQPSAPVLEDATNMIHAGIPLSLWNLFDVFIRFQPLSLLIHDARRAMLYPSTLAVPSLFHIVSFTAICVVIFVIGTCLFNRRSPYFMEEY